MSKDEPTSMEATNDAYQSRVDGRIAANEGKTAEAEKAVKDSGIESVEQAYEETSEAQAIAAEQDEPTPAKKTATKKASK